MQRVATLYRTVIYPSEFYGKFTNDDIEEKIDGIIIIKDLKCGKHDEEYAYYDTDCEINLCNKCITSDNEHKYDYKLNFDAYDIISKKQYIENNLKRIMEEKNENIKVDNNRDELIKLYKIIKTILNAYKKYLCYKHYQNIEYIYDYLIREKSEVELIQIKHENELIDSFNNFENILSVNINGQGFNLEKALNEWDKNNNLTIIINFNNLKELDLGKNKLKNIKPLLRFKMPKLEYLNL